MLKIGKTEAVSAARIIRQRIRTIRGAAVKALALPPGGYLKANRHRPRGSRFFSPGIGVATLALLAGIPGNSQAEAAIQLALFAVDVTPPVGSKLWYGEHEPVKFTLDPQEARGLVLLPSGQQPIVLCAVDWCGIGNGGWDAWREALAGAVGTSVERVAVHAGHQHSGMNCDFDSEAILEALGAGGQQFNVAFAREAIARAAGAAAEAVRHAVPVTHVGHGKGRVEKVASQLRMYNENGSLRGLRYSAVRRGNPFLDEPEGLIDPDVRVVGFWNGDKPVATLSYYACHPQTHYGDGRVSAEIPGVARRLAEAQTGAFQVYFTAAGGNITVGKYNIYDEAEANLQILGERLAKGMETAWSMARKTRVPLRAGDIGWTVRHVAYIPRSILKAEDIEQKLAANPRGYDAIRMADELAWLRRLASGRKEEIARLRLGEVDILHMPGELYVEYQIEAQKMRPDRFVAMAAYGNYGPVYTATAINLTKQGGGGGLDVWLRTAPENENVLRQALADILEADRVPPVAPAIPPSASPYVRAVLEDRPSAYYRFSARNPDEGIHDASGRNLPPGRWYGAVTLGEPGAITGDPDPSVRFDRETPGRGVIGENTLAPIALGDRFTVEMWARCPDRDFSGNVWFASERAANSIIVGPAGPRRWSAYVHDAKGQHQLIGYHTVPPETDLSQWHHYAFTYDGETDTGIMYFDGEPVVTNRQTVLAYGVKRPAYSYINLTIGRDDWHPGADRDGQGWLDEMAFYDQVLAPGRLNLRHVLGSASRHGASVRVHQPVGTATPQL